MIKQQSHYLCIVSSAIILLSTAHVQAAESIPANKHEIILKLNDSQAVVNNKTIELQTPPILLDSTTMVPLRFVGESFGTDVVWNEIERTVTLKTEKKSIVLTIDKSTALVNGIGVQLKQPAVITNNTTMVPLRFVAENMDMNITYDEKTQMITMTQSKEMDKKTEPSPATPKLTKLEKPTVDNLTFYQDTYIPGYYLSPGSSPKGTIMTSDRNGNLFFLGRSGAAYFFINKFNPISDAGKSLEQIISFDERFDFKFSDDSGNKNRFSHSEFIPTAMFYDDTQGALFVSGTNYNKDLYVIFQVMPTVKMITYGLKHSLSPNNDFFAMLNENEYYYSDNFAKQIMKIRTGESNRSVAPLMYSDSRKLVSMVLDGKIYVLDTSSKTIHVVESNSLRTVASVNIDLIAGAISKNGYFYAYNSNGFYRIDLHGKVESYVSLNNLAYNTGIYNASTLAYDPFPQGNPRKKESGEAEPENPNEPGKININGSNEQFIIDNDGNIIIFDSIYNNLRRINVYGKKQ